MRDLQPSAAERLMQAGLEHDRARFDADVGLIEERTDSGVLHPIREAFGYAYTLLQAEGDVALPTVERIIHRALQAQERQLDHIHYGAFKWMDEDQGVTDLNAVQFVLEHLLPLYIDYGERLSPDVRAEILDAVRIATRELESLNVSVAYTNIALLDTFNTVLAGQVLGDEQLLARGRQRLDEWIAFTNRSGAVPEYNSPTYLAVDLVALAGLAERAADPAVAIKARLMEERLWLHLATHYHHPSAQLAGPHSRAYHNDVTGGICGIKHILYRCLGDERLEQASDYATHRQSPGSVRAARAPFHVTDYLLCLLDGKPFPYTVQETADADNGFDLYTYMTPTYALGTVSAGNNMQNNRLILYYRRDGAPGYGVLFSRYLVNEKAFGSFYHPTDRSRGNNLNEEGMFWGLQHENKSIAIYALLPQNEPVHSLKTEVFVLNAAGLDEIWVNDERIEQLPRELRPLDALQLADGDTFVALRPLAPSNLGRAAPIFVQERDGELVLSIYNYFQGEAKRFWEYATLRGPFYKGNIRAGFVIEVGDRAEFGDFATFRTHIARGHVADRMDGNVRKVSYASGGDLLEIDVDLYANRLVERRVNGELYQAAMLRSPTAVQSATGELRAGGAKLHTSPVPAWILADDDHDCWVAAKPSVEPAPWRFETPAGSLTCAAFGFGKVVWRGRESVTIEVLSAGQFAPLRIQAGAAPLRVVWNGQDVTAECVFDRRAREHVLPLGARAGDA